MRKNRSPRACFIGARLLLTSLLALAVTPVFARSTDGDRWEPGQNMRQAVTNVINSASKVTKQYKEKFDVTFGYLPLGAFMGTALKVGESAHEGFELEAGRYYAIIIGGDGRLQQMSLDFRAETGGHTPEGTQVKNEGNKAIILFKPQKTARYRVVIGVKAADKGEAFVGATFLQQNGITAPLSTLEQVSEQCIATCDTVHEVNKKDGLVYDFYSGEKSWAVMGAFLDSEDSVGSDPKEFPANDYALVGAAEKSMTSYFFSFQQSGGENNFVKGDFRNLSDNQALKGVCFYDNFTRGRYMVTMINQTKKSGGKKKPMLAMSAMLVVRSRSGKPNTTTTTTDGKRLTGDWTNDDEKTGKMTLTLGSGGKASGILRVGEADLDFTGTYTQTEETLKLVLDSGVGYTFRGTLRTTNQKVYSGTLKMYKEEEVVANLRIHLTQEGTSGRGGSSPTQPKEGKIVSFRLMGKWVHNGNDNSGTLDLVVDLPAGNKVTGKLTFEDDNTFSNVTGTLSVTEDDKFKLDLRIGTRVTGEVTLDDTKTGYAGTLRFYEGGKEIGSAKVTLELKDIKRER